MTDTLIKVDLTKSPTENENIHNRWHPDIPMACWVQPGDDFILETFDWTGGFIKNDDSADDVRDIDLTTVHYLSGPVGVKGAEPGDLLVVDLGDAPAHIGQPVELLGPHALLDDQAAAAGTVAVRNLSSSESGPGTLRDLRPAPSKPAGAGTARGSEGLCRAPPGEACHRRRAGCRDRRTISPSSPRP